MLSSKLSEPWLPRKALKAWSSRTDDRVVFHDADWIAGVDHDDNANENEEDDDEKCHHEDKDTKNEDELKEEQHVNQQGVNDITSDSKEDTNPTMHEEQDELEQPEGLNNQPDNNVLSEGDKEEPQATESTRRSTQETSQIEKLEPTFTGESCMSEKRVTFKSKPDEQLKHFHNLIGQMKPEESKEHQPEEAMSMARLMNDLNVKVMEKGACLAQQQLLNKGIKVFGQRGRDASKRKMDQLRHQSCFTPTSVAKMTPTEWRNGQQALMFLGEKCDGSVKGQVACDRKPGCQEKSKNDSSLICAIGASLTVTRMDGSTQFCSMWTI
jgi:hypothetical protein